MHIRINGDVIEVERYAVARINEGAAPATVIDQFKQHIEFAEVLDPRSCGDKAGEPVSAEDTETILNEFQKLAKEKAQAGLVSLDELQQIAQHMIDEANI